jgi:hypothetical protein
MQQSSSKQKRIRIGLISRLRLNSHLIRIEAADSSTLTVTLGRPNPLSSLG